MTFVKILTQITPIICGAGLLLSASQAAAAPFTFESVEFMAQDQRLPAAQAFLAQKVTPGMPMAAALTTVRRAGGYCHPPRNGKVECLHASMQRHPGEGLQDVIWKVDLIPAAGDTLAAATVSRRVVGN